MPPRSGGSVQERQEVASQASAAKEELRQAAEIISGKPYLLQCVFGQRSFPGLTQVWRLPAAFPDLPRSAEEACQFFNANPDAADEQQKLFWLQFQDPARPVLLGDRLKQLEELQKMARPAMEDLCRACGARTPCPPATSGWCAAFKRGATESTCGRHRRAQRVRGRPLQPSRHIIRSWSCSPIAEKRPLKDGKEVRLKHYFERVMPAARIAEKDCKLGDIIDNL